MRSDASLLIQDSRLLCDSSHPSFFIILCYLEVPLPEDVRSSLALVCNRSNASNSPSPTRVSIGRTTGYFSFHQYLSTFYLRSYSLTGSMTRVACVLIVQANKAYEK